MSLEKLLNLRYQYERIVGDRRLRYDLPSYDGSIQSLEWFVHNGVHKNRFRKNFNEAFSIAEQILLEYK